MISEERIKEILTPIFIRQDQASIHWPDIFEEVRAIDAEVTAPLEAEIARLRAEQTRLKEHVGQLQRIVREEATDSAQVILERDTLALQNKRYREVLLKLACLGNGEQYGNSVGNYIAQDALSLPHLSTSIIIQHDNEVIERCAVLCEKSDRYRGDYFAEKIRALKQ